MIIKPSLINRLQVISEIFNWLELSSKVDLIEQGGMSGECLENHQVGVFESVFVSGSINPWDIFVQVLSETRTWELMYD